MTMRGGSAESKVREDDAMTSEKRARCLLADCRFTEAGTCEPHGESCPAHERDCCGLDDCPWADAPEEDWGRGRGMTELTVAQRAADAFAADAAAEISGARPLAMCHVRRDEVVEVNGKCPACGNPISWHQVFVWGSDGKG